MKIQDLRYFIKLADTRSYVQTARFFKVSQPAISSMVKRLEKDFDTKLITSENNVFHLTTAGETLYRDGKQILKKYQETITDVKQASSNKFYLGYSELAGKNWLSPIMKRFFKVGCLDHVKTKGFPSPILIKYLENKKLDAIIYSDLIDKPLSAAMITTVLRSFQLKYYISKNNPLTRKNNISFNDIKDKTIITYDSNYLGREVLEIIAKRANYDLKNSNLIIVDNMDTIVDLVRQDIGISLLPDADINDINYKDIKLIDPIKEERVHLQLKLGVRKDLIPSEQQMKCINAIKDLMS